MDKAFKRRAVQKLLDPTQVANVHKGRLQPGSTWASMDALESIITPIFLSVDVATT